MRRRRRRPREGSRVWAGMRWISSSAAGMRGGREERGACVRAAWDGGEREKMEAEVAATGKNGARAAGSGRGLMTTRCSEARGGSIWRVRARTDGCDRAVLRVSVATPPIHDQHVTRPRGTESRVSHCVGVALHPPLAGAGTRGRCVRRRLRRQESNQIVAADTARTHHHHHHRSTLFSAHATIIISSTPHCSLYIHDEDEGEEKDAKVVSGTPI